MKEKIKDSKQILGVDPKTWGTFDKAIDRVSKSKFARVFLPAVTLGTVATGCMTVDARTPTEETAPMPSSTTNSVETPFVEITPFQPVVTEVIPVEEGIRIDLARTIYPPLSNVQESFEKGEYNAGLDTIKQWVNVWEKMGIFNEIEIENNSLSPVPLDGKAKIVCVNTIKQGEWKGTMLCPPLDLVNGGLKAVPENGKWDESDKPLLITFEKTEELVTRGSGNELVYQFMDKYMDTLTRYFDPKTGQIVEGRTSVSDLEVVENEIVIEGATGVSAEFLLDGNLKINEEAGRKYYLDFINSLAGNEQNSDYMVGLLGANPDGNKLLNYLKENDYTLPPGLNLPYERMPGYVNFGNNPVEEPIKLDTLKIVVFGSNQWNSSSNEVKEYVTSLKSYRGLWLSAEYPAIQYMGWAIDLRDNRLVIVAGSKENAPEEYPITEKKTIGGFDGSFNFERDSMVASGELIQVNKLLKVYSDEVGNIYMSTSVFTRSICENQNTSGICVEDITQIFGEGKTMFEPVK